MMKKIAIFILIGIGILSTISYSYLSYINKQRNAKKENLKFEIYQEQEISGSEVASLMNKAIDSNQQNEIEKDENGNYIDNGKNSLNIEIQFIDDEVTYPIEKIYAKGMNTFLTYYRNIKFACKQVQYHSKTNQIKYMLLEQVTQ